MTESLDTSGSATRDVFLAKWDSVHFGGITYIYEFVCLNQSHILLYQDSLN